MTDELTPEEKQAIENLPRERMPAGLEGRVVGAMREHGFLAKRRRTIELTRGRMAGVLAACVALIVGAYSIGLYRGDGGPALRATETVKLEESGRANMPLAAAPEVDAEKRVAAEAGLKDTPASKTVSIEPGFPGTVPAPPARSDEASVDRVAEGKARSEKRAASESEMAATSPAETPASPAASMESAAPTQAPQEGVLSATKKPPITFYLNGSPVIVEAPDSVRVVQDERGRMLLIYTSDGIIRIRLGD